MNSSFSRIITCSAVLLLPLSLVHAQDSTSLLQQKQQEMMQANMAQNRAANDQINRPLEELEQEEMFRAKMRKIMMEKMRQAGQAMWEPTEWQKTLPPIVVDEGGVTKEYSFTELIEADGYLCPGSARAYKALQISLPLLYPDSVASKGDFKITHGSSLCTTDVYQYFMASFTGPEFLEKDLTIKKKLITIERLSTGKKVTVVFDPSAAWGHSQAAAQAGDLILRAQEGQGMTIYVEEE